MYRRCWSCRGSYLRCCKRNRCLRYLCDLLLNLLLCRLNCNLLCYFLCKRYSYLHRFTGVIYNINIICLIRSSVCFGFTLHLF
nr:MAG TPA: hypothetical protein [Caudoviricetes sp.]